jgi:nucleoside 2-deoxyribosyltransferase
VKIAFISGPYRAPSKRGVYRNIRKAAEVAALVAKLGYAVFCPHTNSHLVEFVGGLGDEYWLEADLKILPRCDLVVLVEGWTSSSGSIVEIVAAVTQGIPVYELDQLPEVTA